MVTNTCSPPPLPRLTLKRKDVFQQSKEKNLQPNGESHFLKHLQKQVILPAANSISSFPHLPLIGTNIDECLHELVREVWRRQKNPKKSRAGEVINRFGSTFKGTLDSQGRPSGHGICFLSEQQNPVFERFEGFWEKGVPAGNGKLVSRGGGEIFGKWRKGNVSSLHFIRFKSGEEMVSQPKRPSFLHDV